MAYQQNYVTFSDEIYTVVPGQQNLGGWLNVTADAPPASLNVTVALLRVTDGGNNAYEKTIFSDDFEGYSAGAFPYTGGWELWFDGSARDRSSETYSVWVDGVLKAEDLPVTTSVGNIEDSPSSGIKAFSVSQNYDNVKVYYDDVNVFFK